MDNVKSIVEQRRAKIVSEYYDKILDLFDNNDSVKICEEFKSSSETNWNSEIIQVPSVHHDALIALLMNKGFHIRATANLVTPIRFIITIED